MCFKYRIATSNRRFKIMYDNKGFMMPRSESDMFTNVYDKFKEHRQKADDFEWNGQDVGRHRKLEKHYEELHKQGIERIRSI